MEWQISPGQQAGFERGEHESKRGIVKCVLRLSPCIISCFVLDKGLTILAWALLLNLRSLLSWCWSSGGKSREESKGCDGEELHS
jgi:hypothetical protein